MNFLDRSELRKTVADIAKIEEAGRIDDVWIEFHALASETPIEDSDHCTLGANLQVHTIAQLARKMLEVPFADCVAATEETIFNTRQKTMLKAIGRTLDNIRRRRP